MHDYEKDLELIREESKETLECIANLYLDEEIMNNKNINNIITNDALALSDLKFSISCSKRTSHANSLHKLGNFDNFD